MPATSFIAIELLGGPGCTGGGPRGGGVTGRCTSAGRGGATAPICCGTGVSGAVTAVWSTIGLPADGVVAGRPARPGGGVEGGGVDGGAAKGGGVDGGGAKGGGVDGGGGGGGTAGGCGAATPQVIPKS